MSTNAILLQLCALCVCFAAAQRPPYAGQRPQGYKDRLNGTTTTAVVPLNNRFGGGDGDGAGSAAASGNAINNLPVGALGDVALVNQLNQRPADNRPFWLVNYEAIEAQKNGGRPQTVSSSAAAPNAASAGLPVLTTRFGGGDDGGDNVGAGVLGTAGDTANFALSRPEIVYPLPASAIPLSSPQSQVIMLNGQPFLLTPLASDAVGGNVAPSIVRPAQLVQMQQPVLFFD